MGYVGLLANMILQFFIHHENRVNLNMYLWDYRNYISLYISDILDRQNYKRSSFSLQKSGHLRLTYARGNFARLVYGGTDGGIHLGASQPKDTYLETEEHIHVPHICGYKWRQSTIIHFMQAVRKLNEAEQSRTGRCDVVITPFLLLHPI